MICIDLDTGGRVLRHRDLPEQKPTVWEKQKKLSGEFRLLASISDKRRTME